MSLATIRFPNGATVALGADGRWTGEDATLAADAQEVLRALPPRPRPDWARAVAGKVAAELGGVVVEVADADQEMPEDATP